MPRSLQPAIYRASNGEVFVYLWPLPSRDGKILFSPDGMTYYELVVNQIVGFVDDHVLSFKDPHRDVDRQLRLKSGIVHFDNEKYELQPDTLDPFQVTIVRLPS